MSILQARVEQDVAILDVEGPLSGGPETHELKNRVREMLEHGHSKILLNLRGVPWANSIALGVIVAVYVAAKRAGGHLEICCASKRVGMVFRTMMLIPDLFAEHGCEAEALRAFERGDRGEPR